MRAQIIWRMRGCLYCRLLLGMTVCSRLLNTLDANIDLPRTVITSKSVFNYFFKPFAAPSQRKRINIFATCRKLRNSIRGFLSSRGSKRVFGSLNKLLTFTIRTWALKTRHQGVPILAHDWSLCGTKPRCFLAVQKCDTL